MRFRFILCLLIALVFCPGINAQEGSLQFVGHHFFNEKELVNTKISILANDALFSQTETGKSNSFRATLPFGAVYDIYFTNPACQRAFIRVFADIPVNKRNLKTTYELDIPFFARDPSTFDTAQFRKPFHQIVFDGKSRFVDDTVYMNAFLRKLVKPQHEDTSHYFQKKPVHMKQYVQLVGRLGLDNDKKTLLKNKTVSLLNKNGGKVFSTQTSNHGIFVFQGVDLDLADGIRVELSESDNPNKERVKLQTMADEPVDLSSPDASGACVYRNNDKNQLIKKLTNTDYRYNIGGKLIIHTATNQIASGKEVSLLNSKSSQIQKVKTDVFGNFLFTKIVPGQTYSFAFDTAGYAAAPEIYTIKDKFVKRVDSVSGKNYVHQFRAQSGQTFNDLLLDDSELKMHVKGRLYGENKINPLADFKIELLNDRYRTIDSAMTDKDGDFEFSYMPYNRNLMFNADNEKNILEAFNNILVFDNAENLIKIVSTVRGSKFKYMPLATEQSRLTEVFVDDPWLNVVNAKKPASNGSSTHGKAGPVIIESILFEFNKADLLPQAKQTLDKVALAMGINQSFNIELGAHSDSKGSDTYNLKLSEQRATAAKAYLVSKGVDAARISAKGYGESKLLNNCNNTILCSEDEHAENRRLEFKLIFN
jgi:outer membrane protein OmpA-like peptidoglycan-associated protein